VSSGDIDIIERYRKEFIGGLEKLSVDDVAKAVEVLGSAREKGGRVYTFGNGGSAATASHLASDLNKGSIRKDSPRFKVVCLNDNIPALTAWANDTDYSLVFMEQVENFVGKGDVVVAISGSGNSPNVLNAVRLANSKGAVSVGLTGFDGGKLKGLVDVAVVVPSDNMERVEDAHLVVCHIIKTCLRGI